MKPITLKILTTLSSIILILLPIFLYISIEMDFSSFPLVILCLIIYGVLLSNDFYKGNAKIPFIAWIMFILLIIGVATKIGSEEIAVYQDGDNYDISCGYHPNDTIPTSIMLEINENSDITKYTEDFTSGRWFIYIGENVDKSDFKIVVTETNYLIGRETKVDFYLGDKKLDNKYNKFKK
jgi:hypothetical protein